eukprot:scaffold25603_cov30-Tisochrysis_lutea.AAC.2
MATTQPREDNITPPPLPSSQHAILLQMLAPSACGGTRHGQRCNNIVAGFSSSPIHVFENRAIIAPSTTRWSADQLT